MKPAPFEYHRPASLEEALGLLTRLGGEAKPLAGGQSLIPAMNFRLARPAALVDLHRIPALDGIAETPGGGLRLGAMARQRAVERSAAVRARAPLLAEAMPWVAHPQIRNRGTLGGSLAHADPAAELPAVMLALEAVFTAAGPGGRRAIAAAEFYPGLFTTVLAPDELLVEIEIPPRPAGAGSAFVEVARRHGDFALVGVAAELALDGAGRCAHARVALLSVGDGPVLAEAAASQLRGRAPGAEVVEAAARAAAEDDVDPPSDIHASAAYRRHLTRVLVGRAIRAALARAARP